MDEIEVAQSFSIVTGVCRKNTMVYQNIKNIEIKEILSIIDK